VAISIDDFPRKFGRITQSDTYVPQIDGLRFLAIIEVVCFHALFRGARFAVDPTLVHQGALAYIPNGFAGVELFFFISGYIIAFPFLSGSAPRLRAFYGRRVTRLEPPYLLVLLICFLAVSLAGGNVGFAPALTKSDVPNGASFLASCFYLHDLLFQAPPRLNPPLWSLELEIQFYLLAPFFTMLYRAVGPLHRRVMVGILAGVFFMVVQVIGTRMVPYLHFTIFSRLYPFIIGIVLCDLAIAKNPFKQEPNSHFDIVFVAGLLLFLISASLWVPWVERIPLGFANESMRAVSIVLMYYGCARGPVARRIIGAPWIALIGGACYSIYLVHVPIMQTLGNLIFRSAHVHSLAATFALALITLVPAGLVAGMVYYLLIERPCMRKDWPQRLLARMMFTRRTAPEL
jgi:peptidoglycan/LPS O-acetylase OafA/YrhL